MLHPVGQLEHLDQGVGVGQRRGFGGEHHQSFLGGQVEIEHIVADARAGIHNEIIQLVLQLAHGFQQFQLLAGGQGEHFAHTRGGRQDEKAVRRGKENFP